MPLIAALVIVACRSGSAVVAAQQQALTAQRPLSWALGSYAVKGELETLLRAELLLQRAAWQAVERAEHPPLVPTSDTRLMIRLARMGCLGWGSTPNMQWLQEGKVVAVPHRILSATSHVGKCPWWIPPRRNDSFGLTHEYRGRVRPPAEQIPFSQTLLAGLDSASQRFRRDPWFLSQLVRIAVENQSFDTAMGAIERCTADEEWCRMLEIFVLESSGQRARADSIVEALQTHLPLQSRCELLSVQTLLKPNDAARYGIERCIKQDSLNRTLWWLSQPFFGDKSNLRRSQHVARLVHATLVMQLPIDAHWDVRNTHGGDALAVMWMRYGWPDHHVWEQGGIEEQKMIRSQGGSPPFSAPEYRWPRSATIPRLRAGVKPFTVSDEDYELTLPFNADTSWYSWWPQEHFAHPDGMILPLVHQQQVQLRRRNHARVLIATELRRAGKAHPFDTIPANLPVSAALYRSPAPDSIERIASQNTQLGATAVLAGDVHGPAVMSAEYRTNAHGIAGLRTRFGIADPPTLTALGRTCALSDPILVRADALTGNGIADIERGMLGSTTLQRPTKIGLAWEHYNFSETEPTQLAVRVRNEMDVSRLRQLGINIGIVDDPRAGVRIYWEEAALSATATKVDSNSGAVTRQLTLDISQLRAGTYALEIVMEQPACGEHRASRDITIVR